MLLEGEPWERELVKVQCDGAVTATKKRFLSIVVIIVKLFGEQLFIEHQSS